MKQNHPIQTHFVGVLLPDKIVCTLENCRKYMNKKYFCKSGYGTPIHVTLIPPFYLDESYSIKDLIMSINSKIYDLNESAFLSSVSGFDAFGDRTIFAKIEQCPRWNSLRNVIFSAIDEICPGILKKDREKFIPHATVANRDIPVGVSKKVLEVFNELNLNKEFLVDNICIFEKKKFRWIPTYIINLK